MSVLTGRLPLVFIAAGVLLAVIWQPVLLSPLLVPGVAIAWVVLSLPTGLDLAYALAPGEGGPVGLLFLVMLASALFWASGFGFWIWRRFRRRRSAIDEGPPPNPEPGEP